MSSTHSTGTDIEMIRARWAQQPDVVLCVECIDAAIAHASKQLRSFCNPEEAPCTYADYYGHRLPYEPNRHYGDFTKTPFESASADIHTLLQYIATLEARLAEQQAQ